MICTLPEELHTLKGTQWEAYESEGEKNHMLKKNGNQTQGFSLGLSSTFSSGFYFSLHEWGACFGSNHNVD